MQSASSRIWTRVAVSISYDDNHYTTGTSCIHFDLCSFLGFFTHDYSLIELGFMAYQPLLVI